MLWLSVWLLRPTSAASFSELIGGINYIQKDSNGYKNTGSAERNIFASAIVDLLNGNYDSSHNQATQVGYTLTDTGDGGKSYRCLVEAAGNEKGRGIYCVYPRSSKLYHVSVPHPVFDTSTPAVGVDVFRGTGARYFSISTTHRCANAAYSACPGTTEACGSNESYRESDMAHNTDSFFDIFNARVRDFDASVYNLQIHGCGSSSCPSGTGADIAARISAGTQTILAASEAVNRVSSELKSRVQAIQPGATTRSCSAAGEADYLLCGMTNTQGRYINGSSAPCATAAGDFTNSRFLHLELNHDIRHTDNSADPIGPHLLIESINQVL